MCGAGWRCTNVRSHISPLTLQYLHDVRDLVVTGFKTTTAAGVLAEEPMRGVRVNVTDATLHADKVHRSAAQILPAVRRCLYACQVPAALLRLVLF